MSSATSHEIQYEMLRMFGEQGGEGGANITLGGLFDSELDVRIALNSQLTSSWPGSYTTGMKRLNLVDDKSTYSRFIAEIQSPNNVPTFAIISAQTGRKN